MTEEAHEDTAHLHKSRRNKVDLTTFNSEAQAFAEKLVYEMYENRAKHLSTSQMGECVKNMTCLLLDLLVASEADSGLWIGYSRGKQNFVSGGSYWNHDTNSPSISYTYYLDCIDWLESREMLTSRPAPAGNTEYSSRIIATSGLRSELHELGIDWTCVVTSGDAQCVVVKDENKKPTIWPKPGSFDLDSVIRNLRRINENLSTTYINLDISDEDLYSIGNGTKQNPDEDEDDQDDETRRSPLDFSDRFLRRIFGQSSFEIGGRFYGGWWQHVPSRFRKHIEIDGKMTVELDYSTIQPRILYARAGAKPPEDSYLLPGWDDNLRPITKKLFSQLLNSSESSRNPNQWHRFAPALKPDPLPEDWHEMSEPQQNGLRREHFKQQNGKEFNDLIRDLINHHAPIEKDFFSGVWGYTQNLDSQITELVVVGMLAQDVPVTVLPIHDSFIVRRGAEHALHETMTEAFYEVVDEHVKIDRDEAVFDPPEGYEPNGLINASDYWHIVAERIKTHGSYLRREHQWVQRYGPID